MKERSDRHEQWRVELRASMPAKRRTAIPRVKMPELDADYRITTNQEVNEGLSLNQAVLEATRCLDCPDPGCIKGCPVHNDIPGFIKNIERGDYPEAMKVLSRTTVLPAVCGRVCPQEHQCEASCIYNKMGKPPVSIGNLERFVADFEREIIGFIPSDRRKDKKDDESKDAPKPFFPIKVAVIGSGPSGLSFAGDMCRRGYRVTIFEALSQFGGVLKYGIPEFCLPNVIVDHEIERLRKMGVEFQKDVYVGKTMSYEELLAMGFKGLYVATGAGKPRFMDIPGENLPGVMTANEYLIRLNCLGPDIFGVNGVSLDGKRVAVIGGGNTAIDAVRYAVRQGAERAMIIYRRGLEEMPARQEEIRHAREEGVEFLTLCNPVEYLANERGYLRAIRLQKMKLGEPDDSGRRRPVPIEGCIEEIDVDLVVESVGYMPNPPLKLEGVVDMTKSGEIMVDNASMKSSLPAIYAGGDIVHGPATVILAMGDGRRAAAAMSAAFEKAMGDISL
ncbi:MAG: NADPH-dependent glutamate synthase [Muribaculaceae bacterium]|nr:NADPH-dependent glutamate synthase [Bacteroidales bacterium]MDY2733312.1 NADPH-dependent glutamate synthase [Muribaculaceae bacterium]MDY4649086.1 NADPH-dependent glutamate synthase [Muribaculaceae bacterium]